MNYFKKTSKYELNNLIDFFLKAVWLLANLITFLIVFFQYENSLEYFYLRKIVKVRKEFDLT